MAQKVEWQQICCPIMSKKYPPMSTEKEKNEHHGPSGAREAGNSPKNEQERLEECATSCPTEPSTDEQEQTEWKEQYIRLCAEFENYKKRMHKEQHSWITQASKQLLTELIPVIDDFELALAQPEQNNTSHGALKGIALIYKKFLQLLHAQGVKSMEVASGDAFNEDCHEALTTVDAVHGQKKGAIAQVVNKGYMLGDQVLRFAKVIVYV